MSKIRDHILKFTYNPIVKGFYSTGIAQQLKLPFYKIEQELDNMVNERLLLKKYQLLCTNDHYLRI